MNKANDKKIAVLIPCYNENQTIGKVVAEFRKELPDADIIVFDNNSTDGTDIAAKEAGADVRYEFMQGKGAVVRTMFRTVEADCYILVDGDDTYPAEYSPKMVDIILSGKADMVVGDRLSTTYARENKRLFHNFGNHIVKSMIQFIFHQKVSDIMTGYRAFNRMFVKSFPIVSNGFEIETEMTMHALDKQMKIVSIPIEYRDRPEGSTSKLNTFTDGIHVITTIFRLFRDYKPLFFFAIVSLVLGLIGLFLFVPILIEYIRTGLVLRFPTLIISVFIFILSVLMLMNGIVLQVIANRNRQMFEIQLTILSELNRIGEKNG